MKPFTPFRKNVATLLNVLGLAVAFAAFIILMKQVTFDLLYNKCYPDQERLFRIEADVFSVGFNSFIAEDGLFEYLSENELVDDVCPFYFSSEYYCLVNQKEEKLSCVRLPNNIDFFDYFGFQCTDGDFKNLDSESKVVICKSFAEKLFPKTNPIGQTIELEYAFETYVEDTVLTFTVAAVYEDMPANSTIQNPLVFIELPYEDFEFVYNKESLRRYWNDTSDFVVGPMFYEQNDSGKMQVLMLFEQTSVVASGGMMASSDFEYYGDSHSKMVRVDASTDSTAHTPVLLKKVTKYPEPYGEYYCKLKPDADPEALAEEIKSKFYSENETDSLSPAVRLVRANDIHFETEREEQGTANRFVVCSLLAIAILVLVVALINFVNYAMAVSLFRIREMNTMKVIGASRATLRFQNYFEYGFLFLFSYVIALLLVGLFHWMGPLPMLTTSAQVTFHAGWILLGTLCAVVLGLLVAILPTHYLLSIVPAMTLKGKCGLSRFGKILRETFVGIQFFISFVLLACTLYVAVQNHFLNHHEMGFQTENVWEFDANVDVVNVQLFMDSLKHHSEIDDVTGSSAPIVRQTGVTVCKAKIGNRPVQFEWLHVSPNFISFFGMKMTDGNSFPEAEKSQLHSSAIFNVAAREKYQLRIGETFKSMSSSTKEEKVIGFVNDFNYRPLHDSIMPLALTVGASGQRINHFFIKYEGKDMSSISHYISEVAKYYGCEKSVEVKRLQDSIEKMYEKEQNFMNGLLLLSGIVVLIAMMGMVSILFLEMNHQKQTIGIQRVYGADSKTIVLKINLRYLLRITICFLLSLPCSIWLMRLWMENFVYNAPIPVWIFAVAFAFVALFTILVVTLQSIFALRFNLSEAVRNE